MTTFQVHYRNRILDINPADLIRRVNAYWYRWELPGRVKSCEYVRIPWYTEYEYTCEPPPVVTYRPAWEVNPRAIQLWKPLVIYITADMIGSARKGIPGIDIGKSSGVVFKDAEAA